MRDVTWNGRAIKTDYWLKPIPTTRFDWSSYVEDSEDEGMLMGYGSTRGEAMTDLLQQLIDGF